MKNIAKSLLAAGALTFSALSHAVPVDTWLVQVVGSWSSFAPNPGVTQSGTQLSWGQNIGNGQSSLNITNPAATLVNTYIGGGVPPAAFIAPSVSLTHANNAILAPSLDTATLTVNVNLTPTVPVLPGFALPAIAYNIDFLETPNQTPCAVGTSPTPCNDIFVLLGGFLNETFEYMDETYFINAFPIAGGSLGTLTNAACLAVGQPIGCLGFTTPEGQATNLAFGLTISSERLAVPEPGSLALIGLAMAGLAATRRRRSAV